MKAYDIVGFAYEGDVHCVECATFRFPQLHTEHVEDSEGNLVHPIFAGDECACAEVCGDCLEPLL
jgi:hypothetical protein